MQYKRVLFPPQCIVGAALHLLFLCAMQLTLSTASAQTTMWQGDPDLNKSWNLSTNWDFGVPTSSTDAIISMNGPGSFAPEPDVVIDSSGAAAKSLQYDSGFLTIDGLFNVGAGGFNHSLGVTTINTGSGGRLVVAGDAVVGGMGAAGLGATSGQLLIQNSNFSANPALDVAGTLTIGQGNMDFMNEVSTSGSGSAGSIRAERIVIGDGGGGTLRSNAVITAIGGDGLVVGDEFTGNGIVSIGTGTLTASGSDIRLGKDGGMALMDVGSASSAGGAVTARDIFFGDSASNSLSVVGSAIVNARNIDVSSGGMLSVSGGTVNLSGNLETGGAGMLFMSSGAITVAGTARLGGMGSDISGTLSANQVDVTEMASLSGSGTILANTVNVGDPTGFNAAELSLGNISLGTSVSEVTSVSVTNGASLMVSNFSGTGADPRLFAKSLVVDGSTVNPSRVEAFSGGKIDISETILLKSGGALSLGGAATILTANNVTLDGGFIDIFDNAVANISGTLNVKSGQIMTHFGGELNLGTVDFDGAAGEVLEMSGEITGSIDQSGGTLAPGSSPGLLVIGTDYNLNSGVLEMELGGVTQATAAGPNANAYDHLDVNGDFTIGAGTTLNVVSFDMFAAANGNTFELWDVMGATNNQFSTINLPTLATGLQWDTSQLYSNGIISVTASAVPEPSSLAVLAVGLCAVLVRRRRKDVLLA